MKSINNKSNIAKLAIVTFIITLVVGFFFCKFIYKKNTIYMPDPINYIDPYAGTEGIDSAYSLIPVTELNDSIIHQYVFEVTKGNKEFADIATKSINYTTDNWSSDLYKEKNNLTDRYNSYGEPMEYDTWVASVKELLTIFFSPGRHIMDIKESLFCNDFYPVDPFSENE